MKLGLTHIFLSAPMQDHPKIPEFLHQNEDLYSRNVVQSPKYVEAEHHATLPVSRGWIREQGQIC